MDKYFNRKSSILKVINIFLKPNGTYTLTETGMYIITFTHGAGVFYQSMAAILVKSNFSGDFDFLIEPQYLYRTSESIVSEITYNPYSGIIKRTASDNSLSILKYFIIKIGDIE